MYWYLVLTLCALRLADGKADGKRPVYNIGHMANSIHQMRELLDMGANALESDITFNDDGTLKEMYHGPPCDCNRVCNYRAQLSDYLDHLREVTDPKTERNCYNQLIMQFFELKLDDVQTVEAKERAGQELADCVLDHLWDHDDSRRPVKVLLLIHRTVDNGTLAGFINRCKSRGAEELLKENVGFDGGMDEDIQDVKAMLESLGITDRIWQGDGTINCHSPTHPDVNLRKELQVRDDGGYIDKVYHWTIDDTERMRKTLKLEADGLITNRPDLMNKVLQDEPFALTMRLATPDDDPFAKFVRN